MSGGAIAGTVIGAISGPLFGIFGYMMWKKQQADKLKAGSSIGGVTMTSSAQGATMTSSAQA